MTTATSGTVTFTITGSSALATLAASLSAGQSSTNLGDTGFAAVYASNDSGVNPMHGVQWINRFFYDVDRSRAFMLTHSEGGSPNWACLYSETSNSWTFGRSSGTELGHIYESCAYDPSTARLFTGHWGGTSIQYVSPLTSLTAWTNTATTTQMTADVEPAMVWHPNLYGTADGGMIVISGTSVNGKLIAWRASTNTWADISGATWVTSGGESAAYRGAGLYVRGGNYCIVSRPGSGGKTFKITAGSGGAIGTATQIEDPPIDASYPPGQSGTIGAMLDSPSGGDAAYLLEKAGSRRVWKWNGTTWGSAKGYSHPFTSGQDSGYSYVTASCYPLGVFWSKQKLSQASVVWKPND